MPQLTARTMLLMLIVIILFAIATLYFLTLWWPPQPVPVQPNTPPTASSTSNSSVSAELPVKCTPREVSRECRSCHVARVITIQADCIRNINEEEDLSCTEGCPLPTREQ